MELLVHAANTFLIAMLANVIKDIPGATFTAQMPLIEHLTTIGIDVIKDITSVGDDQPCGLCTRLAFLEAQVRGHVEIAIQHVTGDLADQLHVFHVNAGFRLIKEYQIGLLGHELKQFGPLNLTTGKTSVDIAVKELRHVDGLGQQFRIHFTFARTHLDQVPGPKAMDGRWPLKRHADAESGPLVHGDIGNIRALERDFALDYVITGKPHQGHEKGCLAGTIWPEKDESLPFHYFQIDPFQDHFITDIDMQVFNGQHVCPHFESRFKEALLKPAMEVQRFVPHTRMAAGTGLAPSEILDILGIDQSIGDTMGKKKNIHDLSDLKQIKFKKEKEDIYKLPYEKKEVRKVEDEQANEPPDEDVFMAAMQGVKEMDDSRGRQVTPKVETSSTQSTIDSEKEAENDLKKFMHGEIDFELEYTDEFMYGYVRGLDIKTFQQLKSGSLSITSHLDLHGMTTDQAQESLLFFIRESYLQSHRCILIVTGRGKNSPGGQSILRRETEIWLTREPLKRVVLAFCTAQPKDGGAGAIYVLLRKQKKTQGKIQWDKMFNWEEI